MTDIGASRRGNRRGNIDNLKPGWKPGQSGNAKGRPPAKFDIATMCREHGPAAVQVLVQALRDPKDRIEAARILLDRGFGRAPLIIEGEAAMTVNMLHLIAAKGIAQEMQAALDGKRALPPPPDESRPVFDLSALPVGPALE